MVAAIDNRMFEDEVAEMIRIIDVLARIENTFGRLFEIINKDKKGTLYTSAFEAQETCFKIIRNEAPRDDLMKVMDTLRFAQNTVETINYVVEMNIQSDYTKDIRTAWFNANLIRMGNGYLEFKKYTE